MITDEFEEQKIDELKTLRARAFVVSHPHHNYSKQFEKPKKITKHEQYLLGLKLRREARARKKEEKLILKEKAKVNKQRIRHEAYVERIKKAYELNQENGGRTLKAVGDIMGITRERVRQLMMAGVRMGLFEGYYKRHKHPAEPFKLTCKRCGKEFLDKRETRAYCSKECRSPYAQLSLEEKAEYDRRRQRERYHSPIGKAKHTAAMKRHREKLKADPVRYAKFLQGQKKYHQAYHERKRLQAMINVRDTLNEAVRG